MGYNQVFPHVGSNTQIQVLGSNKPIWPLVTGTFGGTDFIHSLLGEATDHISQTSLTDLNAAISDAEHQNSQELFDKLKTLVKLVPSASSDLDTIQQNGQVLANQGNTFHLQGTPGDGPAITAQEIAKQIYPLLALRDKIMKSVTTAIEKVRAPVCADLDSWTQGCYWRNQRGFNCVRLVNYSGVSYALISKCSPSSNRFCELFLKMLQSPAQLS